LIEVRTALELLILIIKTLPGIVWLSRGVAVETSTQSYGWQTAGKDANMCTVSTQMETVKIGIREFRENLADYLEANQTLAITRHGETLGFYIPAQKRSRKVQLEAMRAAAKELDDMIASWGATEDELMDEYKQIRRSAREAKRNAK
jgi:hypothetical protein